VHLATRVIVLAKGQGGGQELVPVLHSTFRFPMPVLAYRRRNSMKNSRRSSSRSNRRTVIACRKRKKKRR